MSGGYPPGAANDSRAPYNQREPKTTTEVFDTDLDIGSGDPIKIKVQYTYAEDGREKLVTDYGVLGDHAFLMVEFSDLVQEAIREQLGDHVTFE